MDLVRVLWDSRERSSGGKNERKEEKEEVEKERQRSLVFVVKGKKNSHLLAGGAADERRLPVDHLLDDIRARCCLEAGDVRSGVLWTEEESGGRREQ